MSQSKTNKHMLLVRVAGCLGLIVAVWLALSPHDDLNPAFRIVAAGLLALLAFWALLGPLRNQPEFDHLTKARDLLAAVDRGGTPSNPAIINEIARGFGLEISSKAPMHETIERIRQAVERAS